jgi:hypothetical protein
MTPTRRPGRVTRFRRNVARVSFVTLWLAILGTASITPASADAREDCIDKRNNDDDAFWVPQDVIGEKYKIYCPNGAIVIWDRTGGKDVNGGDDWKKGQDSITEYARKHVTLGGAADFSGLKQEPCEVFHPDVNKGEKVDFWLQCAKITGHTIGARYKDKKLKDKPYEWPEDGPVKDYEQFWYKYIGAPQLGVCEQWRLVYTLLRKKAPSNLESLIRTCRNDDQNALYYLKGNNPRIDNNVYDTSDYSAHKSVVEPLSDGLGVVVWVGLFIGVLGVLAAGGHMALVRHNGGEAVIGVMWVLVGCVLMITATAVTLIFL